MVRDMRLSSSRRSICSGLLLLASTVLAQEAPLTKRVEELETQVQELKKSVEQLQAKPASTNSVSKPKSTDPIARIREEGLDRSKVMETLSYLTEVIGPRLTGSPNLRRANDWTRDKLSSWGLANAHLEAWGPFGRGWSLKRFSIQVTEPQCIPLIGAAKAWSPGFDQPLEAEVVYLDAKSESDLEKYKGKLKGRIVLSGAVRELKPRFEPLGTRMAETNLLRLANAGPSASSGGRVTPADGEVNSRRSTATNETNATAGESRPRRGGGGPSGSQFQSRALEFAAREEAALVVTPSTQGDGGTFFIGAASVPGERRGGGGRGGGDGSANTNEAPNGSTNGPRVWSTNAPVIPAQITLAVEDYNRLVRMLQQGEQLKMAVDLQVQFHGDDVMAYNTIAEIPGSDLKDEVVMLGGHIDSWHSGTGATDNAAGVAATMEAVRILTALDLKPRRTIRIGLWSGEEQGLLGSKAYVAEHFGYYTNVTNPIVAVSAVIQNSDTSDEPTKTNTPAADGRRTKRELIRGAEYEKLSAYFNLDNGAGKIRGVYMQNNEAVRPLFRKWLAPFRELGAETLTLSNTGGTDHQSFDAVGLPGFQFIQDAIEYSTRTHHSNQDVFDRVPADDLKQAATIIAAFVYNAAMEDQKLPRKPVDGVTAPTTVAASQ